MQRLAIITIPESKLQQNIWDSSPDQSREKQAIQTGFCSGTNFLYLKEMKNEDKHKVGSWLLWEFLNSLHKLV